MMHIGKKWKLFWGIVLFGIITGVVIFLKVWFQPERDVRDEQTIAVTAQGIVTAYNSNEKNADSLYLNKAIEVNGEIAEVIATQDGKTVVALKTADPMAGVRCTMKEKVAIKSGQNVTIKGLCTGFLMDVTLIDCYLDQ